MKYTVVELQNGVIGGNSWVFDDIEHAESKCYSILAVAAVSSVPVHSVAIINSMGVCVFHKGYDRTIPEESEAE